MLHDPRANATPSQIRYAMERSARLEKMAQTAPPSPPQTDPPKETPQQDWQARQFEIHPLQKAHWFAIEEDLGAVEIVKPKIREIQTTVCKYYEITHAEMTGQCRTAHLVRARHVAIYLCKRLTTHSLPEIGRRFGGRDHTTALSAYRRIDRLLQTEDLLKTQVTHLANVFGGNIA